MWIMFRQGNSTDSIAVWYGDDMFLIKSLLLLYVLIPCPHVVPRECSSGRELCINRWMNEWTTLLGGPCSRFLHKLTPSQLQLMWSLGKQKPTLRLFWHRPISSFRSYRTLPHKLMHPWVSPLSPFFVRALSITFDWMTRESIIPSWSNLFCCMREMHSGRVSFFFAEQLWGSMGRVNGLFPMGNSRHDH